MTVNVIHGRYNLSKVRCRTRKEGGGILKDLEQGIKSFLNKITY